MITVHSPGLEHNLLNDPADQPTAIYLPEAYSQDSNRRFPVLYFLHGYSDTTPRKTEGEMFARAMDADIAAGRVQPMIVVVPNGANKYKGAFYANSTSTGNWEDYIVRDLVSHVDSHYRTLASPQSRAIAGHSMGGYGALTLAFRHPDIFGFVYAMSPCCTDLVADFGPSNEAWKALPNLQSPDEVPAELAKGHFFVAALSAFSAAVAPDPQSRIFGDPAFVLQNGTLVPNGASFGRVWAAMPVNMVVPLRANIAALKGIFIEYGAEDNFAHIPIGAQELSRALSEAGISHTLEVYEGDHGNRIVERIAGHLLPWISGRFASPEHSGSARLIALPSSKIGARP